MWLHGEGASLDLLLHKQQVVVKAMEDMVAAKPDKKYQGKLKQARARIKAIKTLQAIGLPNVKE